MIYLIRHGMTAANERRLYRGSSDLPLSEAGRRMLSERRAAARYPDARDLMLISSGMRRCDETARPLFGREADRRVDGLREIDLEGLSSTAMPSSVQIRIIRHGSRMRAAVPHRPAANRRMPSRRACLPRYRTCRTMR